MPTLSMHFRTTRSILSPTRFETTGESFAFSLDRIRGGPLLTPPCRNGWGATAVDALSTAILMRKGSVVRDIVNHIPKINFDETDSDVSLFETTIRYVGGLLSGACCSPSHTGSASAC